MEKGYRSGGKKEKLYSSILTKRGEGETTAMHL